MYCWFEFFHSKRNGYILSVKLPRTYGNGYAASRNRYATSTMSQMCFIITWSVSLVYELVFITSLSFLSGVVFIISFLSGGYYLYPANKNKTFTIIDYLSNLFSCLHLFCSKCKVGLHKMGPRSVWEPSSDLSEKVTQPNGKQVALLHDAVA